MKATSLLRPSDAVLGVLSALAAAVLVVALAAGLPGAADLDPGRGLASWVGLGVPAALLGGLLIVRARSAEPLTPAQIPVTRLVRLVALVWGLFRLFGSAVTAGYGLSGDVGWLSVRDAVLLAALAASGAGLAAAALRPGPRGLAPVLGWCGCGLVVGALTGVAAAAAGSAAAAALLLARLPRRSGDLQP